MADMTVGYPRHTGRWTALVGQRHKTVGLPTRPGQPPAGPEADVDDHEVIRQLLGAAQLYDPVYDEIFQQVAARIREHGEAGKLDLAALITWKRSGQGRWVNDLMGTPDEQVRRCTRAAFQPGLDDLDRLTALAELPGFESMNAIPTAVLACWNPARYGVYDRRARDGLKVIERPVSNGRGRTLQYLGRLRQLRDLVRTADPHATARSVDQALWQLGGPDPKQPR